MNYKKLILVGCISAFVALLTSVLGVAGTVIGSVISSVLYNMLSEALEKPVSTATFSSNFEWEVAYIFPLVVIAIIQVMLIFAILSELGFLPSTFLEAFLSLQHFTDNNLYRILGCAMLVISVYPLVLKPDIIKKSHGAIIAFVGLIFLARGFVDLNNRITDIYDVVFINYDLPIAIIALLLILFVIVKILLSAKESEKEFRIIKHQVNNEDFTQKDVKKVPSSTKNKKFDYDEKIESVKDNKDKPAKHNADVKFSDHLNNKKQETGINESSENIQFESNGLLDDYKK